MTDFPDVETLPDYPCFFTDVQPAYDRGDYVWVVCDPDFQIGYIVGPCETSVGSGYVSMMRRINEAETAAGLLLSSYEDLTFHQQMEVALDFYNRSNKQCGRIIYNGTVIIYGADSSIFIKNPQATILLSKEGDVSIKGRNLKEEIKNMDINAKEVKEAFTTLATTVDGSAKLSTGSDLQLTAGGHRIETTTRNHDSTIIGKKIETIGLGERKRIVAGGSSTLALLGNIDQKAVVGMINQEAPIVKITGGEITIQGGVVNLNGAVTAAPAGLVVPNQASYAGMGGPFCAIPVCPLTGLPHQGNTLLAPLILGPVGAEMLTPVPWE